METWLTLDRVVFVSGWSKRHIRRLASTSRIQTRDKRALCIPGNQHGNTRYRPCLLKRS
jgi:ribosomal silencing factor RsfS